MVGRPVGRSVGRRTFRMQPTNSRSPLTCAVALLTFWIACYVQFDDCSHMIQQQYIYYLFHGVVVWPVASAPCGPSNWSSVGISLVLTMDWILRKVSSSSSSRSIQAFLSLTSWIQFLGFSFLKSFVTSYRHLFFGRPLVLIPLGFQSWS
jgi:hypothetical protein